MGHRSVPSALSLANSLPTILCGIIFFLPAGIGNAEDNPDKGNIDAKSFRFTIASVGINCMMVPGGYVPSVAELATANVASRFPSRLSM